MNESAALDQTVQNNTSELPQENVSLSAHQTEHSAMNPDIKKPILFFDGICGLCNSSVDFALVRDKNVRVFYSPLQGETAKQLLSEEDIQHVDTVVFRPTDGNHLYRRSAAVVRLLWLLTFPWNFYGWILWFIPLPIRDLGYRLIAGSRYRLFGKHETCRMPTPEERSRFLP